MLKVLLADDHHLMRDGIKMFLESDKGIKVIGEANNGNEAIELCQSLKPDLLLMDISMPEKNGIEAASEILNLKCVVKIIMLSMHLDEKYINTCMETGVHG